MRLDRRGWPSRSAAALALGALVIAGGARCTSDAPDERGPVMRDLAQNVMLPTVEELGAQAAALGPAVQALCDDPGAATLDAAQDAWRAARAPWEQSQAFLFGPAVDLGTASAIDFWPARPDSVDLAIASAPDPITPEHLATLGTAAKGLPALEYLLWSPAGGDAAVLASLDPADPSAAQRCAFAAALGVAVGEDAGALADAWSPEGGGFADQVATAGDGSDVFPRAQDAINRLVNSLVALLQGLTDMRLGAPLGTKTGGVPQPDQVESRFSDGSAADLVAAVRGIEAIYLGRRGDREGRGLTTLVAARGKDTDESIRAALTDVIAKIEAIPAPLRQAVEADPASVQAALDSGKALRRLVAVDMANVLGVSVTLNDNDGD